MMYKTHPNFSRANEEKILAKLSSNNAHDKINMNIITDNTFNLYNILLNNEKRYMKVTLKSKLIGVASELILADYCKF